MLEVHSLNYFYRLGKHFSMVNYWMSILLDLSTSIFWGLRSLIMILRPLILITLKTSSGCLRYAECFQLGFSLSLSHTETPTHCLHPTVINSFFVCYVQNDISDVLDLTFSIDADEEKLILYERTEVMQFPFSGN